MARESDINELQELRELHNIHFDLLIKKRSRPMSDFYKRKLENILEELEKEMSVKRRELHIEAEKGGTTPALVLDEVGSEVYPNLREAKTGKLKKLAGLYVLQKDPLPEEVVEEICDYFGENAIECTTPNIINSNLEFLGYELIYSGDRESLNNAVAIKKLEDDHFLFTHKNLLPDGVYSIVERMIIMGELEYSKCQEFLLELNELGYTFEYGLDSAPFDLRPMSDKEVEAQQATVKEK